jgi:PTH1 family peptidyl-tRNA hydrolase
LRIYPKKKPKTITLRIWSAIFNLFKKESIPEDPMKYLIVGLGNIGGEYAMTRHNAGFEIVDYLAKLKKVEFNVQSLGMIAKIKHKGRTLILLKPSTYMNRSGKAVRYWMQKEKIKLPNVLIVVDEIHLPLCKIRIRGKGSDGGHNGLKDIGQVLNTSEYARLKVGIGNEFSKGRQVDFVLGKWSEPEIEKLQEIIPEAAETVLDFTTIGLTRTMNNRNN